MSKHLTAAHEVMENIHDRVVAMRATAHDVVLVVRLSTGEFAHLTLDKVTDHADIAAPWHA